MNMNTAVEDVVPARRNEDVVPVVRVTHQEIVAPLTPVIHINYFSYYSFSYVQTNWALCSDEYCYHGDDQHHALRDILSIWSESQRV